MPKTQTLKKIQGLPSMKILISAGPTREKIDPVRYISNRSSGKMGYALAEAAVKSGASVTLVSGPVSLTPPSGLALLISVESAAEMTDAIRKEAESSDVIIMCAAVADYRPVMAAEQKLKKKGERLILELEPTEDILAGLGGRKKSTQILVGFAAETEKLLEHAEDKLKRKNLDWIIANDVSRSESGFESDKNQAVILGRNGAKTVIPLQSKKEMAETIISVVCGKNNGGK